MYSKLLKIEIIEFNMIELEGFFTETEQIVRAWCEMLKITPMRVQVISALVLALDCYK